MTWYNLNGYATMRISKNMIAEFIACDKMFVAFTGIESSIVKNSYYEF